MTDQLAVATDELGIASSVRVLATPMPYEIYAVSKPDLLADPSWHPDGTSLIFVEVVGSDWSIATMNIGATPNHTLVLTDVVPFEDPMYSADGNFISFAAQESAPDIDHPDGVWGLYFMKANGTDIRTILSDGQTNRHPVWVTPTQLAFQWSDGVSAYGVSLIGLDGQGRQDLGEGEYPRTVVM